MTHTLSWTFEELGKGENKSLDVEFECEVSPGSPGGHWEPPEPPEVDFVEVKLLEFGNDDGEIAVSPSWQKFLKGIAFNLAEKHRASLEETLLERLWASEEAALDDYYDRKRDEQRGC